MGAGATSRLDGSLFRVGDTTGIAEVFVYVSLLVVVIVVLEQLLHHLEHRVKASRKHDEMLRKVYRELMILGFLGVAIKVYKEITHISAYSPSIIAFQCADLTIFILAIALILQAICVFLALRHENYELEQVEITSSGDLATMLVQRDATVSTWCTADTKTDAKLRNLFELRVLRHLFLRRYGLPELFPFSKYVREAQDNQITHMIDIQVSTWLVLLGVTWAIEGAIVFAQQIDALAAESHAIVLVLFVSSWLLVAVHVAVAVYFRNCIRQLLRAEGLTSPADTVQCLVDISDHENAALQHELASDALLAMQEVQERQDAKYRALKRQHHSHHFLARDTGFQLLMTAVRHVLQRLQRKLKAKSREHSDSDASTVAPSSVTTSLPSTPAPHRRRSAELGVTIRWFSREAWQFLVILIMMLNGLYLALLCQCVAYQFGALTTYTSPLRAAIVLGLPIPVVLNMVLLQPTILHDFMIVSSILQVDVTTLSKVVTHFSEIVELRAEFARTLLQCLETAGVSAAQLDAAFLAKDRTRSGTLELDQLRLVLRDVGFRLSYFRFHSVAKLLFERKGATVAYAQVSKMLALAQADSADGLAGDGSRVHHDFAGHVLLRQSVFLEDDATVDGLIDEDAESESARAGGDHCMMTEAAAMVRRQAFVRRGSSFQNTSMRTLRSLYLLSDGLGSANDLHHNSAIGSHDLPASPTNISTAYVRV